MATYKLLTVGKASPKGRKGEKFGYATAVLHFAPYKLSGYQVCGMAEVANCFRPCLNISGKGGMAAGGLLNYELISTGEKTNRIQQARIRRTVMFFEQRGEFFALLIKELNHFVRWARRKGLIPVVRLNGTSDIRWEDVSFGFGRAIYPHIFSYFSAVQFYDYTKIPNRRRALSIPNYHLTFSYSAAPSFMRIVQLAQITYGDNVNYAVVFKRRELPAEFMGRVVIDGDESDLRFLDGVGKVVGLTAKTNTRNYDTGFMVP